MHFLRHISLTSVFGTDYFFYSFVQVLHYSFGSSNSFKSFKNQVRLYLWLGYIFYFMFDLLESAAIFSLQKLDYAYFQITS